MQVRSGINVTPLVDVVLVLLIIFMVIAPQLESDASVKLPTTDQPQDKPDDGRRIKVVLEVGGNAWIDGDPASMESFPRLLREAAVGREDWKVVLEGDARLTFGEVQRAMFAVEAAGFRDVSLIAEPRDGS